MRAKRLATTPKLAFASLILIIAMNLGCRPSYFATEQEFISDLNGRIANLVLAVLMFEKLTLDSFDSNRTDIPLIYTDISLYVQDRPDSVIAVFDSIIVTPKDMSANIDTTSQSVATDAADVLVTAATISDAPDEYPLKATVGLKYSDVTIYMLKSTGAIVPLDSTGFQHGVVEVTYTKILRSADSVGTNREKRWKAKFDVTADELTLVSKTQL